MQNRPIKQDTSHVFQQLERRFNQDIISPELFLIIQEVMEDVDQFEASKFEAFELEDLFVYLKKSHEYYLEVWMPKLENTLAQLYKRMDNHYKSLSLLALCLSAYKKELKEHIEQEEKVLFAFVERLLAGKECDGLKDLVLNHFIHTHDDNVILEINKLKREVLSIDADLKGNLILEILFNQLHIFQQDLKVHGLIEDEVFLEKVILRVKGIS